MRRLIKFVYKINAKINIDEEISELEDEFTLDIEHDKEIMS